MKTKKYPVPNFEQFLKEAKEWFRQTEEIKKARKQLSDIQAKLAQHSAAKPKAKPQTIWLNKDGNPLMKYQETIAQNLAAAIAKHDNVHINIPAGYGKRYILHRVVQLLQNKHDFYFG